MQAVPFIIGFSLVLAGCAAGGQGSPAPAEYSPYGDATGITYSRVGQPVSLIKSISDLGGAQKKFETNADFEGRMSKMQPFEVCKAFSSESLKFDPATGASSLRIWLPDAQLADYRENNGAIFSDSAFYYPSIEVARASRKLGEYVGQNSFGASAVVEMGEAEVVHLVFEPIPRKTYMFPHPFIEADARSVAGKIDKFQLCISAIPVSPYYREGTSAGQATIQNPSSSIVTHQMLRVKVGALRLADMSGKSIDGKVTFSIGQI